MLPAMKTFLLSGLRLLLRLSLLVMAAYSTVRAQGVGIGTTVPDASAALEVAAAGKGLLLPRLTEAARAGIALPARGLLVFQTNGAQPGFWYNAGSAGSPAWTFLSPVGVGDNLGTHLATQTLNLQGQALTGTGASIGTVVGVGIRADGGLNLGQNTAGGSVYLGFESGQSVSTGARNVFAGRGSGAATTTGSDNVFSGHISGQSNNTGRQNTFLGARSGQANRASFNTFLGANSGETNTTGTQNVFVGISSGYFNLTGTGNTFAGAYSGLSNTTGSENVFLGLSSGEVNTAGNENTFLGAISGALNTTGGRNTFVGGRSGQTNTTGEDNTFVGHRSGAISSIGGQNVIVGSGSGERNEASENVFLGYQSGFSNSTGSVNTFAGYRSGFSNTTADFNTFTGYHSGLETTTGRANTFTGGASGQANVTGTNNVFMGVNSGVANVDGNDNTFSGRNSGAASTTGDRNTFVGRDAGDSNTTGSFNTALGYNAGPSTGALTRATAIGYNARVAQSNALTLGGTGTDAVSVGIGTTTPDFTLDVNGGIRCVGAVNTTSDARLKTQVRPLSQALAGVQALRGVRYTFRQAEFPALKLPAGEQVGLLAQEVERVYPELVSTDREGIKSVNYAQLAPVLIEAIKEQQGELETLRRQAAADRAALLKMQAQLARLLDVAKVP